MRLVMINGSPKSKGSASGCILEYLNQKLDGNATIYSSRNQLEDLPDFNNIDAIVLAFPLYGDSLPGHFLAYIEQLRKKIIEAKANVSIYTVINCGFYEAKQNHIALRIMKNWCGCTEGATWARGVLIGGGGMIGEVPIGKGPMKKIGGALDELAGTIKEKETGNDLLTQPNFPRRLYIAAAHMGWRREGKKNNLGSKELRARLVVEKKAN